MVIELDPFILALCIGVIIGSINAYFHYQDEGRRAAIRIFVAWMVAFTIAGLIASPFAEWLIPHLF